MGKAKGSKYWEQGGGGCDICTKGGRRGLGRGLWDVTGV